jgi:hypothetical protein
MCSRGIRTLLSYIREIEKKSLSLSKPNTYKKMSLGDVKDPAGGKGSNYNWQLRMLQVASKCCTPVVTESERLAIVNPPIGKLIYQTDGTEGLWVYKSTGWVYVG